MPRTLWHDESLTRFKVHPHLGRALSCQSNDETPFEQIQRFVANWCLFQ